MPRPFATLPDPQAQPEYYDGLILSRLMAWVLDALIISVLTFLFVIFTALTAILVLGAVALTISLIYRWLTIAAASATPGMRAMGIALRDHRGEKLSSATAFWHSALFLFFKSMAIPQVISVLMMATDPRGQGLHDAICGVVAINRAPRQPLAQA